MPHNTTQSSHPVLSRLIRPCLISVALLFCHISPGAQAAELGNIRVHSWLGRQLKASVPLVGEDARQSEPRCFKASLINLNNEVVGSLKVTLQHSSMNSFLLLAGGNAIDEPAATVRVENVCGAGERRDYAVLLDQVPEAPAVATNSEAAVTGLAARDPDAPAAPMAAKVAAPRASRGVQAARALETAPEHLPVLPRTIIHAGMRLAATLPDFQSGKIQRASHFLPSDSSSMLALRLEQTLAVAAVKREAGSNGMTAFVAGGLSLLVILGAAAWIALRIRAMRASAKPWIPVDMRVEE